MCGRYSLFTPPADLEERFDARFDAPTSPTYNAAPGQRLPVVTDAEPETIQPLEWGLLPAWADDDRDGLINARAETVDEKPSFRPSYERSSSGRDVESEIAEAGRCLVLADGFYEWTRTDDGKRPYRIAFEDDRPFAMAGLWATWRPETVQSGLDAFASGGADDRGDDAGDENDARVTFTIVTTEPNDVVEPLHHRMAAILEPDSEREWLAEPDPKSVLTPHDSDSLRAYPVSTAVNAPKNDDPSLVEPVDA
ncbi:SOS response-associated peptidase [Halovivax gelatinilyticus]|uniref:SOS response-associated peptidase n=1 Tax=Halovivax gelatinilyticus TaxID=2961597 RepID=UPI0020CA6822|nr:SOS response-associated peptidase [Halovivax gelatinilyticus]